MRETRVQSLSQKDLEKEMATPSSILAWKIPCTEEPGRARGVTKSRTQLSNFTHFHFVQVCVLTSSSYKDTNHFSIRVHPMTSLECNYLCKASISSSHTLGYWDWGLQHVKSGEQGHNLALNSGKAQENPRAVVALHCAERCWVRFDHVQVIRGRSESRSVCFDRQMTSLVMSF